MARRKLPSRQNLLDKREAAFAALREIQEAGRPIHHTPEAQQHWDAIAEVGSDLANGRFAELDFRKRA